MAIRGLYDAERRKGFTRSKYNVKRTAWKCTLFLLLAVVMCLGTVPATRAQTAQILMKYLTK